MADFDERVFPYVFECDCGTEVEVTWRGAVDLAGHLQEPGPAAEFVVRNRHGWGDRRDWGLQCPECVGE